MTIDEIRSHAREQSRVVLTEIEAKNVLSEVGINCTDTRLARTKQEAVQISKELGYPVVLKISSIDISHKSDADGVYLNLNDSTEVEKAYEGILSSAAKHFPNANVEGVSVQSMMKPGMEIIIGMTKDPQFGPVVMFGLGGVFVEVLKDVTFRIVPLDRKDVSTMIKEIKGYQLLEGYRGQDPVMIVALEDILMKLSAFVDAAHDIKEIDMNPVFAYPDGAVVVDARMVLEDVT